MVLFNLTCLHCLPYSYFEHLFNLYLVQIICVSKVRDTPNTPTMCQGTSRGWRTKNAKPILIWLILHMYSTSLYGHYITVQHKQWLVPNISKNVDQYQKQYLSTPADTTLNEAVRKTLTISVRIFWVIIIIFKKDCLNHLHIAMVLLQELYYALTKV